MTEFDTSASRPIADFLSRTGLAPRQAHKLLDVWPIVAEAADSAPAAPPYVTLADAEAAGALRVDEVGGGSVPHVHVENQGDVAVLVLFGEEIHGALVRRPNRAGINGRMIGQPPHVPAIRVHDIDLVVAIAG